MDAIKTEAFALMNLLLQGPTSHTERWISAVAAVAVLAWVFLKVGDRMDLPNVGIPTSFLYTGLGAALVIVGMAAAHIYLPGLHKQLGDLVFYTAIAVAISAAVVTPVINTFINGTYLGTLSAWLIGVVSALVAIAFLVNVYAFIDGGGRALKRGSEHNEATKQLLK